MKFNIFNLESFKQKVNRKEKKVSEILDSDGKNIYKNISGHEDEINYRLYDAGEKITGLTRHVVSVTEIWSEKVNGEFKMTTGHSHPQEEVYMFLRGEGKLILNHNRKQEDYDMSRGDSMTIPAGVWHRVVNSGKEN